MTECFAAGECEVTINNLGEELEKMKQIVYDYDFEELFSIEY